jgi:AbrB family looped-hinge helix DNA binding protein
MALTSTVSSKGQVTIPQEIRVRLGLKEGDRVEFVVEDGKTLLRPARDEENPFRQFLGVYPAFKSMEEINAWISDMRDEDPDEQ